MNKNNTVPEFINNFTNYLLAIKNLSQSYVSNMVVTLKQFINFINVHKFNNKYDDITSISLNDIRSIVNSDIYSFIFFLAERHYEVGSRTAKIEHLRTFFDYLYRIKHNIFKEPFKEIKRERYNNGKLPNRSGINIKVIQELLGHTKVETTEIYTHLYDEEVFKAMQKHPLSKFKMKNAMEYCEMAS